MSENYCAKGQTCPEKGKHNFCKNDADANLECTRYKALNFGDQIIRYSPKVNLETKTN